MGCDHVLVEVVAPGDARVGFREILYIVSDDLVHLAPHKRIDLVEVLGRDLGDLGDECIPVCEITGLHFLGQGTNLGWAGLVQQVLANLERRVDRRWGQAIRSGDGGGRLRR